MKALVLGGVRSGKSRIAARIASEQGRRVVFVATAWAGDEEMQTRIDAHRRDRPGHWRVEEAPFDLAARLRRLSGGDTLLVDCLTMWLTNLLCDGDAARFDKERRELLSFVGEHPHALVLVSNETNMGVTPTDALSRRFCDEAGELHQRLAALCDTVILAVAGLPHILKSPDTCGR